MKRGAWGYTRTKACQVGETLHIRHPFNLLTFSSDRHLNKVGQSTYANQLTIDMTRAYQVDLPKPDTWPHRTTLACK